MFLADIKELFAAFPTTKSPEEARKLKELNLLLTSKNKNAHFLFFSLFHLLETLKPVGG